LDEHGFTDTGTTEQANLTAASVGSKKIDDLNTSDEHFGRGCLVNELWGVCVDWQFLGAFDGASLVNWVTCDVHDTAECTGTNGNHDWGASVGCRVATNKAFGTYQAELDT